jgi:hypothetical protein
MKTYRIVEESFAGRSQFLVQRKSIFGFWYNTDNVDGSITGWYNTLEEAKEYIKFKKEGTTIKIHYLIILLILLSGCVTHRPRYNHYAKPYEMSKFDKSKLND